MVSTDVLDPIVDVTTRAFRHSLERGLTLDWPDEEFQASVRRACRVAKVEGLQVEQLIVLVRQSWRDLGGFYTLGYRAGDDAISDVISLLIREFYDPTAP